MTGGRPASVAVAAALVTAVAAAVGGPAFGHDPFQITTDARLRPTGLDLYIVMSDDTAAALCLTGRAGDQADGAPAGGAAREVPVPRRLDPATFATQRSRLEGCARALYVVSAAGVALRARAATVHLSVENDVEFTVSYPAPPGPAVRFDAVHLKRLDDPTFGAELTVTGDGTFLGQALLRAGQSTLEVSLGPATTPGATPPPQPTFAQFLRLGIEHILTGYDHLLFLVGLLVMCQRVSTALAIVTCFTVAHSLTLALAALDVVALSGRVVEPLIAATVVVVGLENLGRGPEPRGRVPLTFAFGLLHGLGFASALRATGLGGGGRLVVRLLAFNLGVELGQVLVATVVLAALWQLRRVPWFARHGTRLVSLLVAAIGAYWLARRALG